MADIIRAVQYGCGPIGVAVGSLAARRRDIELVGALDVDPEKVGRDLGMLREGGEEVGVMVSDDAAALFAATDPDVVFHTTGSSFPGIFGQRRRRNVLAHKPPMNPSRGSLIAYPAPVAGPVQQLDPAPQRQPSQDCR